MYLLYRSNNFWNSPWKYSCMSVSITFVPATCIASIVYNDRLWAYGISKCLREQRVDYKEVEELFLCPSWSNSLWQGWRCGLVHCPGGNATDRIRRVLASSDGISRWTPLKPQHSNPNTNRLSNELWCIDFLTPPTPLIISHRLPANFESLMPLKNRCSIHAKWSKSSLKHYVSVAFFQV